MLKWIIGALVIALLWKRESTPNSVTAAAGSPPEGNISTWANSGSRSIGSVDAGSSGGQFRNTRNVNSIVTPVPPVIYRPSVSNFRTRGFYTSEVDRYDIPGRQ